MLHKKHKEDDADKKASNDMFICRLAQSDVCHSGP